MDGFSLMKFLDVRTIVGMMLIVCGGVYIFIREKAQDQSIATEKPLR